MQINSFSIDINSFGQKLLIDIAPKVKDLEKLS